MLLIVAIWFLISCVLPTLTFVSGCDSGNEPMHGCLHTYLERDFWLVEEMLKRQYIRDGREFDELCGPILEMQDCYDSQRDSCTSYPHFSNLLRVIYSLRGVYDVLCTNQTYGFKTIIINARCIESARHIGKSCKDDSQFDFPFAFAKMMRFQTGVKECEPISNYRSCLLDHIRLNRCSSESIEVINRLFDAWNNAWCLGIYYNAQVQLTPSNCLLKVLTGFSILIALRTRNFII